MAPKVLDQPGLPAMKPPPQSAQRRLGHYLSSAGVGGIASATETSPGVELLLSFTTWGGKEKRPGANWHFGEWRPQGHVRAREEHRHSLGWKAKIQEDLGFLGPSAGAVSFQAQLGQETKQDPRSKALYCSPNANLCLSPQRPPPPPPVRAIQQN